MKRIKKSTLTFIMMIIIIVTIVFGKSNISLAAPDGTWQSSKATVTLGEYINSGASGWMSSYWNTYCIQHGAALRKNMSHLVKYKVEIRGNTAKFYNSDGSVKGTVVTKENNVLAAILTPNDYIPNSVLQHSSRKNSDWWSIGMYVDYSHAVHPTKTYEDYSRTQLALYWYINDWASACSAKGVSTGWSYGAKGIYDVGDAGGGVAFCEKLADYGTFNVDLYYLEANSYQNLLVTIPYDATEGTPTETTSVTVKKVWSGDSSDTSNRKSVTVQLKANGVVKYTQELNSSNGWSHTFTDLPTGVTYSVSEVSVPGYTTKITGDASTGFTITNTLQTIDVKVTKKWSDDSNRDKIRPDSVKVTLYENGTATSKTATLSSSNSWTATFEKLPKYKNKKEVKYEVYEDVPSGYIESYSGNGTKNVTITNSHTPEKISVNVKKVWDDSYNGIYDFDELRPDSITVTLYANGSKVTKDASGNTITNPITLSGTTNEWIGTFTNLYKYESGKEITYTVEESGVPEGYKFSASDPVYDEESETLIITNTHTPYYDGYVEITGKVWSDGENGKGNVIDGVYVDKSADDESKDKLLPGIKVRLKDKDGNLIGASYYSDTDDDKVYCGTDYAETAEDGTYTIRVNYDNSQKVYRLYEDAETVTEKLKTAYVEFEYDGMLYTTVATATTGANTSKAIENEKRRDEIDGGDYGSVNSDTPVLEKAIDEKGIITLVPKDDTGGYWNHRTITASTKDAISFNTYEDRSKKTSSEIIKYCDGEGRYVRTKYDDSTVVVSGKHTCEDCEGTGHTKDKWKYNVDVIEIQNVNLGLFVREQPDVAIFSDISKVEVEMNGQKYTYLYGIRGGDLQAKGGLQTKFQNKDTYTYRRPVNPADIAYIKDIDDTAMNVYVTYEITVGNLSSTLTILVDSIANDYDSNYKIKYSDGEDETERYHITYGTMDNKGNITGTALQDSQISEPPDKEGYKEVILSGLGIKVTGQQESKNKIYIRYKMNQEKLKELFQNTPPLNNAIEILSYTTQYGKTTKYAEGKEDGKKENTAYAGYDFDSHPGNANIKLIEGDDGVKRLYSTDKSGKIIPTEEVEDDTDIAPSFVLCLDEPKTLAGTVWEDTDDNTDDYERLGNGYQDIEDPKEKTVQNVKVELFDINGTTTKLYNKETKKLDRDAVVYTKSDGNYKLDGVVTGEYYIKFTYGDDTTKLEHEATTMDEGTTTVNARNYKSTIIKDEIIETVLKKDYASFSEEEKKWHITHKDGYSVAVDNMEDRLKIPDLQYSNFNDDYIEPQNMTAYTKPFKTQVEFEATGQSKVDAEGNIADVTETLDRLDFGISERPRENLYAQKIITYVKLTLANGQVLTEGDPRTQDLSYVKAMGFGQVIDNAVAARNAIEKQLLIEIDAELIQSAQLEVQYEVTVTNNNEIDYDYGTLEEYKAEFEDTSKHEYDKYITKNPKANYYYYANDIGLDEMTASIEFVDYLDSEVSYKEDVNKDWTTPKDISDLKNLGLVSSDVETFINKNSYKVLQSDGEGAHDGKVTLARGQTLTPPLTMTVSKLLTSKAENVFDNGVEIIKIDGKTARTIQESRNGEQIEKEYKPGNYIPSASSEKLEQDDDRVKVIITPPTGITNYITTYVIAGLAGLIIIVVGIVFIKKKILIK